MNYEKRVIGCFQGLATGDAIGKQSETLTRADVLKRYPGGIRGFHGRPGDVIPRYSGTRYEWRIGETTDDTEQSLAVARAILQERGVTHEAIGRELLRCRKSVHPGVSLWTFLQIGDPARVALDGDGCGAAMRSAPVGVIYPSARLDHLVRAAYECAIPTHGGTIAISAAAAVAGAVSAALDGRPSGEVLAVAMEASREAETLRPPGAGPSIAQSIEVMYSDLIGKKRLDADELAMRYFPDSAPRIVPLAITLALITGSAEDTALLAANLGGDSDSVASIGGAIAGALCPETVNREWIEVVSAINRDDLREAAAALAVFRPRV
jgi:ADP-ribosylglycohydrolase